MDSIVTINLNEVEDKSNLTPFDAAKYRVSPYARWFNDRCLGWNKDPEYNKHFLLSQQNYANELLKARGYIFLNQIYDLLGLPRTRAGQVVGWIYDVNNPLGDNFIDFGLYNNYNEDFINDYTESVLLDFNVDGMILDRI